VPAQHSTLPNRQILQPTLVDLLDWKAGLLPCGEATFNLGSSPAQRRPRADGVLAEVDGAGTLGTDYVLGERYRSRPGRSSVAATLHPGPQIENLREAELDRAPRRIGLHGTHHCVRFLHGGQFTGEVAKERAAKSAKKKAPPKRGFLGVLQGGEKWDARTVTRSQARIHPVRSGCFRLFRCLTGEQMANGHDRCARDHCRMRNTRDRCRPYGTARMRATVEARMCLALIGLAGPVAQAHWRAPPKREKQPLSRKRRFPCKPPLFVQSSSRLLPQPGGFEGFLPLLVEADVGDGPIADRPNESRPSSHFDPVATPKVARDRCHDVPARIDELV